MVMIMHFGRMIATMLLISAVCGKSIENVDNKAKEAASSHVDIKDHSNNQAVSQSKHHDVLLEDPFDHFNRCVMSCAHCGKTESPYFVEEENDELVMTCANSCIHTTNYHDILYHLVLKNLFTRSFARCFVSQMTDQNFEFNVHDLD